MRRIFKTTLTVIVMLALVACGKKEEVSNENNIATMYDSFELTSASLNHGKWDDEISNTDKGKNLSPELKWEPVAGAKCYAIYMVDIDMQYYIHWKAASVTETSLPAGWATKDYVGPYPPEGGKHTYDIYVFALKNDVERLKGGVDGANPKFPSFIEDLDTDIDGNTGNVISCGYLTGTFKN